MPSNPSAVLCREDLAITRMIALRARRGETLEHIARTSRIPYSRVRKLAAQSTIRYKHRRPSPEQVQQALKAVRTEGCTFRQAASQAGISRSAVHRLVQRRRQKAIDEVGELKVIDGEREYSRHKRSWQCPEHGRLTVWPCIACAAMEAQRARRA